MAFLTDGGVGLRNRHASSHGHYQVYTTDGGAHAYLPYGGSHNIVLFYNPGGYGRMVGRVDWALSISQQHAGHFNFQASRYGVTITNIYNSNGTYADFQSATNIGGNVNYHGVKWHNGNGNSWGNGSLHFCVQAWCSNSGSLVSGANNSNSTYTSHSNSSSLLRRVI